MSPVASAEIDPASHHGSHLLDITTDGVPVADRVAFWRERVVRRNDFRLQADDRPFQAHLRRLALSCAELVEHASDALVSMPATGRPRMDGGDDIAVELVREGNDALLDHNGEHRLQVGDLYVVDYARPLRIVRPRHRASGIVVSRRRVMEVMGEDLSGLAARRIPCRGMAAVLRRHMTTTLDEAPHLSATEQADAVGVAAEMALAILQAGRRGAADVERFDSGFHVAARRLIERHCTDPDLTPARVAAALGCSRASLYRLFATRNKSVDSAIWSARIKRSMRMLCAAGAVEMQISDIARLCGFRDMPTFTRMFRRRYGMTPREVRHLRLDQSPGGRPRTD